MLKSSHLGKRFTLIELMLVIGIISILVAMLMPALKGAKDMARQSVCLSNMKQIGQAVSMYCSDYDDFFPSYSYASRTSFVFPSVSNYTYTSLTANLSPLRYIAYSRYITGPTIFGAGLFGKSHVTTCPVYLEMVSRGNSQWAGSADAKAQVVFKHGGTYAFNSHFDQTLSMVVSAGGTTLRRFSSVPRLSERAYFVEGESSEARAASTGPVAPTTNKPLWWGHANSGNFLFGDQHAESKSISAVPLIDEYPKQSYGEDTTLGAPW